MTTRVGLLSVTALGAVSVGLVVIARPAPAGGSTTAEPIVSVVRHGGLCVRGGAGLECRLEFRISDSSISGSGHRPRRLKAAERTALLRSIKALDFRYLRSHPFKGICPTASDGQEAVYRFRAFPHRLASCTYDLDGVRAVELTDRLLASLKPVRR